MRAAVRGRRLEDIAGPLTASTLGVATVTTRLDPQSSRTLFVVYSVSAVPSAANATVCRLGATVTLSSRVRLLTGSAGSPTGQLASNMADTSGADGSVNRTLAGAFTPGSHVVALGWDAVSNQVIGSIDGGAPTYIPGPSPAAGFADSRAFTYAIDTIAPVALVMTPWADATRALRTQRWLMNRYLIAGGGLSCKPSRLRRSSLGLAA